MWRRSGLLLRRERFAVPWPPSAEARSFASCIDGRHLQRTLVRQEKRCAILREGLRSEYCKCGENTWVYPGERGRFSSAQLWQSRILVHVGLCRSGGGLQESAKPTSARPKGVEHDEHEASQPSAGWVAKLHCVQAWPFALCD